MEPRIKLKNKHKIDQVLIDLTPRNKNLSKVSFSFDKLFRGHSIEDLKLKMYGKNPNIVKKAERKISNEDIFDIENMKKEASLKKINEFGKKRLNKIYPKNLENQIKSRSPEPGKYNPNFNSIFKKTQFVMIKNPTKQTFPIKPSLDHQRNFQENENKIQLRKKTSESNMIAMQTQTEISKELNLPKVKSKESRNYQTNKPIKGISFDKYLSRGKYYITSSAPQNILTYIENPQDFLLNHSKNRSLNELNSKKNFKLIKPIISPAICTYNPRFTWIDKNINVILFDPKRSVCSKIKTKIDKFNELDNKTNIRQLELFNEILKKSV